jgi:undecaprenyl-diphosphatase
VNASPIRSLVLALKDYRAPGDLRGFEALNRGPHPWLDQVMILASRQAVGLLVAALVSLLLAVRLRRKAAPILLLAWSAVGISDLLAYRLWKPLFARVRPCYVLPVNEYRQLVLADNSGSLPSSHASNSFAFAMVVSLCYPPLAPVALPLAALIALSRVFVGVHWPSDVLAGAAWGVLVALALLPLRRPLTRFLERPRLL